MAKKSDNSQEKVISLYKTVFTTGSGVVVLHDMFRRFGMFKTSLVPGDPQGTAFNEGQRSVLLYINEIINTDMKKFNKVVEEQKEHYDSEFGID
jgi:hypothetical protein